MFINRHDKQRSQTIARYAAAWFTFFALVVPAFHRHVVSSVAPSFGTIHTGHKQAQVATASRTAAVESLQHDVKLVPQGDDDCALCQWFSVGFTPPAARSLLFAATASTLLILSVRLLALCKRPLPRRGLRAPPVRFA